MSVPAGGGVAAILHEARSHVRLCEQDLELLGAEVAHSQRADSPLLVDSLHGEPRLPVLCSQTHPLAGSMQHVGVYAMRGQVL